MRWFVEEIGPITIVSRTDETSVFEFTTDGGATWRFGDRSLGYRMRGNLDVEEITEAQAMALLPGGLVEAGALLPEIRTLPSDFRFKPSSG